MNRLRLSPPVISVLAIVASILTIVILAAVAGVSLHHIFDHVSPRWIVVVAIAQAVGYLPYMLAYRQLTTTAGLRPPRLAVIVSVVLSGFGPFVVGGGFKLDQTVLHHVYEDRRTARTQVIGLIALEWAVLAPLAALCAIGLLIAGVPVMGSMLWPWAIGVPLGFAVALWVTRPSRRLGAVGRRVPGLDTLLGGVRLIHTLIASPLRSAPVWVSMTVYWIAEIVAVWAALRMFGVDLSLIRVAVAYATGYIVSRRSLPLAGAAVTEVLLTFALHWLGAPLGPALAAVTVYRLFNLCLAVGPSLLATRGLRAALPGIS